MSYFSQLGQVWYTLDNGEPVLMNDITAYADLSDAWRKDARVQIKYTIREGELPHMISDRLYGSVEYWWTILKLNNIYDFDNQWPRTPDQLASYIERKYPGQTLDDVHHYINPQGLVADVLSSRIALGLLDQNLVSRTNYIRNNSMLGVGTGTIDYEAVINGSWSGTDGWTIESTATAVSTAGGHLTGTTGANTNLLASQAIPTIPGTIYNVSMTRVSGVSNIYVGHAPGAASDSGVGTFAATGECDVTFTATAGTTYISIMAGDANQAVTIGTVSVRVATPGVMPSYWSVWSSEHNLVWQVVGSGSEEGIPYVDVRMYGIPSASAVAIIWSDSQNIQFTAGDVASYSAYVKLQAGTLASLNGPQFEIEEHDINHNWLASHGTGFVPTGATLDTQRYSTSPTIQNGNAAYAVPLIDTRFTGGAVDVTLRIGAPQLERGSVTNLIPTTGSTVTVVDNLGYVVSDDDIIDQASLETVSIQEFELAVNESKKQIILIDPDYIQTVQTEYDAAMGA